MNREAKTFNEFVECVKIDYHYPIHNKYLLIAAADPKPFLQKIQEEIGKKHCAEFMFSKFIGFKPGKDLKEDKLEKNMFAVRHKKVLILYNDITKDPRLIEDYYDFEYNSDDNDLEYDFDEPRSGSFYYESCIKSWVGHEEQRMIGKKDEERLYEPNTFHLVVVDTMIPLEASMLRRAIVVK